MFNMRFLSFPMTTCPLIPKLNNKQVDDMKNCIISLECPLLKKDANLERVPECRIHVSPTIKKPIIPVKMKLLVQIPPIQLKNENLMSEKDLIVHVRLEQKMFK